MYFFALSRAEIHQSLPESRRFRSVTETHSKTVRDFQISILQGNGENPSGTVAAVPKVKLTAQIKSDNMYFCKFTSLYKPLETQKWHSLIVSITR